MNKELNISIYRAKKIDSNEYVEGVFDGEYRILTKYDITKFARSTSSVCYRAEIVDPSTLAIHFPNMIATDKDKTKIFASMQPNGKGGDLVEGLCRDINPDELVMLHAPVNFKGVVRFYNETIMGVVIETKDKVIARANGHSDLVVKRGEALRWSDCRQNLKVTGIQE